MSHCVRCTCVCVCVCFGGVTEHIVCAHTGLYWPGHSHRCTSITAGSRKDSPNLLATSRPAPISPMWPSSLCPIITPLYFHLLVSEWGREGGREGESRRSEKSTKHSSCLSYSTEELIKFRFKPTSQWKQKFAEYIATVPSYYAQVKYHVTCCVGSLAICYTRMFPATDRSLWKICEIKH